MIYIQGVHQKATQEDDVLKEKNKIQQLFKKSYVAYINQKEYSNFAKVLCDCSVKNIILVGHHYLIYLTCCLPV